jgi:hypothetical protein
MMRAYDGPAAPAVSYVTLKKGTDLVAWKPSSCCFFRIATASGPFDHGAVRKYPV